MDFAKLKKYKDHKFARAGIASLVIIIITSWATSRSSVFTDNAYLKSDITVVIPKVAGYITEIPVKDNSPVKAGDIIAKIDNRDYQLKLSLAKNNLDISASKLKALEDSITIQNFAIDKASYVKNSTKATLDKAQKAFDRAKALAGDKAIAQKDLDNALAAQINARNDFEAANSEHEIQLLQKNLLLQQKEQAQASLLRDQASLELAQLDLENTSVKAAVDGKVSSVNLQVGQLVSPATAIAYLVHDNIWLVANFKETQVTGIKIGSEASFTIDSFPGVKFKGRVNSLSPASGAEFSILPPENATGNFTKIVQRVPVKITFDDNQDLSLLRSGLSTQVTVYND